MTIRAATRGLTEEELGALDYPLYPHRFELDREVDASERAFSFKALSLLLGMGLTAGLVDPARE